MLDGWVLCHHVSDDCGESHHVAGLFPVPINVVSLNPRRKFPFTATTKKVNLNQGLTVKYWCSEAKVTVTLKTCSKFRIQRLIITNIKSHKCVIGQNEEMKVFKYPNHQRLTSM